MELPKIAPDPPFEFGDDLIWSRNALRAYARQMIVEKETANPRKAEVLEREIGHVVFELFSREQEERQLESNLETVAQVA